MILGNFLEKETNQILLKSKKILVLLKKTKEKNNTKV